MEDEEWDGGCAKCGSSVDVPPGYDWNEGDMCWNCKSESYDSLEAKCKWQWDMLERSKSEMELMCSYFESDWQVVLHKNDVLPGAKKWLSDLEKGPTE